MHKIHPDKSSDSRTKKIIVRELPEINSMDEAGDAHLARRDERAYREYVSEEQRSQAGCMRSSGVEFISGSSLSEQSEQEPGDSPLLKVIHPQQNHHYELHIEAAKTPATHSAIVTHGVTGIAGRKGSLKKINIKVWNALEWLATSALIFVIIFFVINFSSYSIILKSKLDKLRGYVEVNPFISKILQPNSGNITQALLPSAATPQQSKTQIPVIALQITPPDDRIIISRINKNVPIVQASTENLLKKDWNGLEKDIQSALQDGVVHYPGTAQPGDHGNVVITGHSSYFPWDPGRFKDVFALLHQVKIDDQIVVYHNQQAYRYQVYDIKIVMPDQVDVLTQEGGDKLTLITCTPVGTNLKRLIVQARPV